MKQARKDVTGNCSMKARGTRRALSISLTAAEYRRLDLIARAHGYVIEVADLDGDWGRVSMMVSSVYRDVRDTYLAGLEMGTVALSPRIDASEFWSARRPEIDLSEIPVARIYEFVLWHELGHLLDNYDFLAAQLDKDLTADSRDEWVRALRVCNEVLADRFAWKKLYGDRPMPVSDYRRQWSKETENWLARLDGRYGRSSPRKKEALPADPLCYVPWQHLEKGVPLVRAADREVVMKPVREAREAVLEKLLQDAAQAGIGVYPAEGPDSVMFTWRPDMREAMALRSRIESASKMFGGAFVGRIQSGLPSYTF